MVSKLFSALTVVVLFLLPGSIWGQAPSLGSTANFVIFTTTGAVSNTGLSNLIGNVGTNTGAISGFGNVNGVMHDADATAGTCAADLLTAYNQLNAAVPTAYLSAMLGGVDTLIAGVYQIASATSMDSNLVLNAQGNPNAVFIFQIQAAFSTVAASKVILINGAKAYNVFWKIEGLVSLAAATSMKGTIIAHNAAIAMGANDTLEGRAFSTTGAISGNTVYAHIPVGNSPVLTGPAAPPTASTSGYALFSGVGAVTNTGATYVTGDIGTNSGAVSGFTPALVTGVIHAAPDASTAACTSDLINLYNYLYALPFDIQLLYPLQFGNGLVLTPHVYIMNAATVFTGTVFMDAEGDPNAVFVIQVNGAFSTSLSANVILVNGAQAKNVFWKIDGAVSINNNSSFCGTIVANNAAININSGVKLSGKALTTNGALATYGDTIIIPSNIPCTALPILGTPVVCTGDITTLTDSSGGTWVSSDTTTASINIFSGVALGANPGTATITYTSLGGCVSVTTFTVNITPSSSGAANSSPICTGGTVTFNAHSSNATAWLWTGPNSYSSTLQNPTATPTITGTYSLTVSTTGSGCNPSTVYTTSVTVIAAPTSTGATNSSPICIGSTVTLSSHSSNATAWSWTGPNSFISSLQNPIVTPTVTGTYSLTLSNGSASGCSPSLMHTTFIVTHITQQWNGTISSAWSNAANWACGNVPTATQDVIIPGALSYTFAPALDMSTAYAHKLTINSMAVLMLGSGNNLSIADTFVNNGTVAGAGVLLLNGNAAQVLKGTGIIANLQLNNATGATIPVGDTLKIKGVLTLASGTLTTNNDLVLMSDSSGNGSIGTITGGTITGNVTVQQYITGGRRAYRFWAHPFSSSIPLSQMEQYIDITGYLGSTNGFTTTISNAPSAYWYSTIAGNSASGDDPGWTAFSNTNGIGGNAFNKYEGTRLFIRGAKGQGLTGATYTPAAVTINIYGAVNTGAVTIPMVKGTGVNEDYNLLGNPYPSATDIGTVINTAYSSGLVAGAAFYVWDPYMGISGQFVAKPIGSPYYLGPNESFEIRTAANGNSLHFAESNKGTSVSDILMRNAESNYLNLGVYDTAYHLWDILNVNFNDAASDNEDGKYDGAKPSGPAALNFYSWSADNVKLSLDSRPYSAGKVIPLGIRSGYAQEFIIKADEMALSGQVYLYDRYLKSSLLLEQGAEYRFTITTDSLSQGDKRFELRMGNTDTSIIQSTNDVTMDVMPNPATDEVTVTYNMQGKGKVSLRLLDMAGITLLEQNLGTTPIGSTKMDMTTIAAGLYMIEITCGEQKIVRRVMKD